MTEPVVARKAPGRGCRKDYMPIGTVVIRADRDASGRIRKTRFIKVNDAFPTGKRWIQYARWWWEENKGPVPKGQIVLRRDGDTLNDDPSNLLLGTPGMKLKLAHERNPEWSMKQHARAADGAAAHDRLRGRIHRATAYLPRYWYPVVDSMSVILNVPYRRRRRLLAVFGSDVRTYPANGHGKRRYSAVQMILEKAAVRPVQGKDLGERMYQSYCVAEPSDRVVRGPMAGTSDQLIKQLERMGIWAIAEKAAAKDLQERK
jgi:hypothetical protein